MGDISAHFNRAEFACKCGCGKNTIDAGVVAALENVRTYFDTPVNIISANRCKTHNEAVGGAPSSQHLLSRAADIQVVGVEPSDVYIYLDSRHEGGLGGYSTFTHVDTRNMKARW